MATPLSADALVKALRAEGLTVREYRAWRTHNRNHKGAWGPINGVMMHHTVTTGTDSSVALCYNGHSSLPGPLCHGVIDKAGVVWLVSSGRANHAGSGDPDVLRAVINESYGDYPPADNQASVDGNARFYGFECINLGDGRDPWPAVQVDAMVRAGAAIARRYGWTEKSVIAHQEWQPGKIDPRGPGFPDMKTFRARIKARLNGSTTPTPTPTPEDEMPSYLNLAMTKKVTLKPNVWHTVVFDAEYTDEANEHYAGAATFASGVAYTGTVTVRVSGLTVGKELQARQRFLVGGTKISDQPWGEAVGTAGTTSLVLPVTAKLGAKDTAGIRIAHFDDKAVTVERVDLKALVWK